MSDRKFKVGDKVKIINASAIESYELNKIGTIVGTRGYDAGGIIYTVDMGRPRRRNCPSDNETCWYLRETHIELINKPNEQLLFDFMY